MTQARRESADQRYHPKSLTSDQDARRLVVEWDDGHVSRFPFIWLRHDLFFPSLGRPDQADDASCLAPEPPDLAVLGSIEADDDRLTIRWAHDDSSTRHDLAWLRDNCLSDPMRLGRQATPLLWTAVEAERFPWFEAAALDDPGGRLTIFRQLRDCGLLLLRNCPTEPGSIAEVASHFGPLRRTHHGTLFNIRSLPADQQGPRVGIGAVDANAQAPHTDEGYRHCPLGIEFFHCLKSHPAGGGASFFVDGLAAAEALRQCDREAFDFLAATPLVWAAERNPEERFRTRGRVIVTDSDGITRGIRVADRTLPPLDLPEAKVEPAYRALRAFFQILYRPDYEFERLLAPGEMAVFDNQRVLHARRAFDPQAGERHLQQVSVDREEFQNLFRQLAGQLGRFDLANWEPDAGAVCQS